LGVSKTDFDLVPFSATTIAPVVSIIPIGYKEKLPFKIAVSFAYATTKFSANRFGYLRDNTIINQSAMNFNSEIQKSLILQSFHDGQIKVFSALVNIIGSSLFSKISIKRSIHFSPAAVVNHNANTSFYKGYGGESAISYNFFSYGIFSAIRFDYSKSAY
jgi:hypothetical protein